MTEETFKTIKIDRKRFAETYERLKTSEWYEYYVQYRKLKKSINYIAITKKKSTKKSLDQKYFKLLRHEIRKVNKFFKTQEAKLQNSFPLAKRFNSTQVFVQKGSATGTFSREAYEMELKEFVRDVQELKNFRTLNFEALRKSIKKHKQKTKLKTAFGMIKKLSNEYFVSSNMIQTFYNNSVVLYARIYTNDDVKEAINKFYQHLEMEEVTTSEKIIKKFLGVDEATSIWKEQDIYIKSQEEGYEIYVNGINVSRESKEKMENEEKLKEIKKKKKKSSSKRSKGTSGDDSELSEQKSMLSSGEKESTETELINSSGSD